MLAEYVMKRVYKKNVDWEKITQKEQEINNKVEILITSVNNSPVVQ